MSSNVSEATETCREEQIMSHRWGQAPIKCDLEDLLVKKAGMLLAEVIADT